MSSVLTYGIAGFTHDKMIHTMPDETYDVIMKIHVRAPFRLIRAAAPYFRVKVRSSSLNLVISMSRQAPRVIRLKTVLSSMFLRRLVCMEMLAKQITLLQNLRL